MYFRLVPASAFSVITPTGPMRAMIVEALSPASLRRLCVLETDSGWKILQGSLPTGHLILQESGAEDLLTALAPWLAKQQVDSQKLLTLNAADDWARINANLLTYGALNG